MASSCPAAWVSEHLMSYSFGTETITLPEILRKTSPISMVQSPGFFSSGIKRQDRKASVAWVSTRLVHNFWALFANALRRWLLDAAKLLEARKR